MLTYHDNAKDYIKMLKRSHGGLAIVGANTVNATAEKIKDNYERELDKFTIRNKFTKGAIKLQKSKPQRSTGEFRKLEKINAKVGVMKMRGGKEHYLKMQEEGGVKSGNPATKGGVPVPLDTARTGGSHKRVVKGALQLQKSTIQELQLGPYKLGVNDPFGKKQRWAILYKYTGLSGTGRGRTLKQSNIGKYGWDLSKQFFFKGMTRGFGIFKAVGKRIRMMRTLEDKTVRIKSTHKFEKSVKSISPQGMENEFVRNAKKFMGR